MAGFIADWNLAFGTDPPPPQTPDGYRIYLKYRGGWKTGYTDEFGTMHEFSGVPAGEYLVRVYGIYDGENSAQYVENSIILTEGDTEEPTYGSVPPSGNADIAGPEGTLNLTPTA